MHYQYNIGCSLNNLKGIRDFIRESLKGHGVTDVVLNEIVLAIDEMCSNLMIHAHHSTMETCLILIISSNPILTIWCRKNEREGWV